MDLRLLPMKQRLFGQQFTTYANRTHSGDDKIERRQLVCASGNNQWNLRQGHFDCADILSAANRCSRKDFDEIRTGLPCGDNLGCRREPSAGCDGTGSRWR